MVAPVGAPEPVSVALPRSPASLPAARALLRERLPPGALTDAACVVLTELVGNAVQHAAGPELTVALRVAGGTLLLEVSDEAVAVPVPASPSAYDEQGRGLALVDALTSRWGTRSTPAGKTVWAELPLAASA